ncbi:MAG: tRNA lysidine(34) synthetase TilS, partial [Prosthecobacter sp.]
MIKKPLSIPSGPALLAISGGRDSVALLHWLISAGHKKLILCHLNHGLRGRESGQDAAFVRRLAARHGLKCEIRKVAADSHAHQHQISVETAGRELRHAFLFDMARKHRAKSVFIAHHADDQAETILGNLCRGSALRGAGGMMKITPMKSDGQCLFFLRPLLDWQRADIDAYIQEHRLTFREDSSNLSLEYRRNRLRHEVLPLLNDIFNRDVAPIIARFGQHA